MFAHVEFYPGDPILSLLDTYHQDARPEKVNLGIGMYFDKEGKLPILPSVQQTELAYSKMPHTHPYLPIEGLAEFRKSVQKLVFGADNPALIQDRIATIQTLGGSGALKIGADFLHQWFPESNAYVSNPTWENHKSIFESAGITVGSYPYYNNANGKILFDEMLAFFLNLPEKSILIMHPCCHNPTGVDLNHEQWDTVLEVIQAKNLIPFMDMAYQGFGENFESDAYAVRKAVAMNLPVFVCNSFSKNLALYGERVGGLSVVCPNEAEANLVLGQLKLCVRRVYSTPPLYGSHIVAHILNDEQLFNQWKQEVCEMKNRIKLMREKLYTVLTNKIPNKDFSYFIKQRGMFSYTGLNSEQVQRLQDEFAIYLVASGRICIAGLNDSNIDYVANAFASVLK